MTNRPLRIALVQTQAENAGAQEISRILAEGLESRGYQVNQIFFFRRTKSFDDVRNARIVCSRRPSTLWAVARFLFGLRRVMRTLRPDAVLTFQHYGNVIGVPVARSLGLRVVIANQVSTLAVMHPLVRAADAFLGWTGAYSRIVINSVETERMYSHYWRAYRRRLVRIDHGFKDKTTAIAPAAARAALGLPQGVTLLGCASRLDVLKQIDKAILVLAIRPALHLAVAGQGSDRKRLEDLANTLGVTGRLHFLGELDPSQIGLFLAGLDVFLHPSRSETFGLAPVEAAQAGIPVVCNQIDILRDVLQVDGRPCALFADVDDTEAFAGAIDQIMTEPAIADTLRSAGRRLVDRYPVEAMVDHYASMIENLVGT